MRGKSHLNETRRFWVESFRIWSIFVSKKESMFYINQNLTGSYISYRPKLASFVPVQITYDISTYIKNVQ